jgi:hypothetical protein
LSIAAHGDGFSAANGQDGGAVKLFHAFLV